MSDIFLVDFAEKLTRQAGGLLLSSFGKDEQLLKLRSTVKAAATKYDRMVDELIIREIRQKYPQHSLLTEESGLLSGSSDWLWIVDSLDGTGNFANSNPFFSVCIAVMHQGELVLGVVFAPAIDEFYLAERGNGAYLNHRKINVSDISDLWQSYVLYCEGGETDRPRIAEMMRKVYPQFLDLRKLGSAGLETAWVAAGKREAYFTTKIEPWDVAPGVILVQEAGGRVTDLAGNAWQLQTADLLFSNGEVHSSVLDLLHE